MNVTHRRVYRSLGRNFSCLFTWKEAWKQTDRPELWSVPVGAVPHIPVLAAEHQENTGMGWICSVMVSFPVSKNDWLPYITGEGCMTLFFYFYFFKGCLRVKGRKAVLSFGHFLRASQICVTVLLLGNFWGWGKERVLKLDHFFMVENEKQKISPCCCGHIHCAGRFSAVLSSALVPERALKTPLSWGCVLWAPGRMASPPLLPWLPGSSNSSV